MNSLKILGIGLFVIYLSPTNSRIPASENEVTSIKSPSYGLSEKFGANVFEAWNVTQGSSEVLVAVVDTGYDLSHPDLKNALYENAGEVGLDKNGKNKSSNGVDDDGDGLIDNVHGWDFVLKKDISRDDHGHGTHIAGIIAGKNNLDVKVSGVAPNVKMMPLCYYSPKVSGTDNLKLTIEALKFAVKKGVKIINYSSGGTESSDEEREVLEAAGKKNILVIVAAGNERSNLDSRSKYYPCAYNLPNVICVGSVDPHRQRLSSSNYGSFVDVFAPGQNILSTLPGGGYGYMTGTSQATAVVAGQAALILSKYPNMTPQEVKAVIKGTVTVIPGLRKFSNTGGVVNVAKSLKFKEQADNAQKMNTAKNTFPREGKVFEALNRSVADEVRLPVNVKKNVNYK